MNELKQTVERVFTVLTDIQPGVSSKGLVDESKNIIALKMDLVVLMEKLSPDHPNMKKLVKSLRMDAVSTFHALQDQLKHNIPADKMSDEHLQLTSLAAEHFVSRCQDYLSSKESLATQKLLEGASHGA